MSLKTKTKTYHFPKYEDSDATTNVMLHPAEANLLMLIKEIQFGELHVKIQNGLPVVCTQIVQTRKLL